MRACSFKIRLLLGSVASEFEFELEEVRNVIPDSITQRQNEENDP